MAEFLDRGTFRMAVELRLRMASALVGATNELTSAELNCENEAKESPNLQLRLELEEGWNRLGKVIEALIVFHNIWLDQINDRLFRLTGEKVALNLPADIQ